MSCSGTLSFVAASVIGAFVAYRRQASAPPTPPTAARVPGDELPTAGHPDARVALADLPTLRNDRLLRAARGEAVDMVPVWAMRQAGRYLPEFRELRKSSDFFTMCRTPELACEVTLQPLRRFPQLDAVIIFSDILIVPQAMGMVVKMVPGRGPVFPDPLVTPADLSRLDFKPDVEATLGYLFDAINLTRQRVQGQVPVIGFAGGPWTLMAYMVEGGGSKTFAKAKSWLFTYPDAAHKLLSAVSDVVAELLIGEYNAGAQYLQVFESWSGELSEADFRTFVLPYLTTIAARVKAALPADNAPPLVVFAKGAHYALEDLVTRTQFDVVGLDWTLAPAAAVSRIDGRAAMQGNLDPCVLYGSKDYIKQRVTDMLEGFGKDAALVANLGHGMHPTHDPEHLGAFFDAVHSVSAAMRAQ